MELLEPQKPHAKFLLDSLYLNGVADDLSDTGTGKTFVACWIAKQMNCPIVVICPNSVKTMWEKTLAKFGIKNQLIINYELLVRGNTEYLNYDLTKFHATHKWWLSEGIKVNFRQDSLVIVDEQHKCRGLNSLASDLLVVLKNQKYKVLGMSATAATSVADMKAFGYKANLHNGENFAQWCTDHGARVSRYGTIDWDADQTPAKEGMSRIHHNLFNVQKIASRMRRADFGHLFPENRVFAEVFDIGANTNKLNKVYERMELELDLLDKRAADYSQHAFAIIMKARRQAEILKTPAAVDFIEDMFDEGISPVIFVNFDDTVQSLTRLLTHKKFKGKIGYLVGGQKDDVRNRYIDDFQSDKLRIFIANIQAGNMGVSLHDLNGNFPRHSLLFPCWSAVNVVQAIGRIYRALGKTPCIQRFFYANVPVEVRMATRIGNRVDNLDCLNDGDVNMEYEFLAK